MNCPKCGRELREYATYCPSCMTIFQDQTPPEVEEASSKSLYPRPTKLILMTWGLLGVNILYYFVFDYLLINHPRITDSQFLVGLIIQAMIFLFTIVCSILLTKNKNRTAKRNGIFILSIMIMALIAIGVLIFMYTRYIGQLL